MGTGLYGQIMDSQKELHSYYRKLTLEAEAVCCHNTTRAPPDPVAPLILLLDQRAQYLQRTQVGEDLDQVLDGMMNVVTSLCLEKESKLFKEVENMRNRSSDT